MPPPKEFSIDPWNLRGSSISSEMDTSADVTPKPPFMPPPQAATFGLDAVMSAVKSNASPACFFGDLKMADYDVKFKARIYLRF